jgi:hypothetical protein
VDASLIDETQYSRWQKAAAPTAATIDFGAKSKPDWQPQTRHGRAMISTHWRNEMSTPEKIADDVAACVRCNRTDKVVPVVYRTSRWMACKRCKLQWWIADTPPRRLEFRTLAQRKLARLIGWDYRVVSDPFTVLVVRDGHAPHGRRPPRLSTENGRTRSFFVGRNGANWFFEFDYAKVVGTLHCSYSWNKPIVVSAADGTTSRSIDDESVVLWVKACLLSIGAKERFERKQQHAAETAEAFQIKAGDPFCGAAPTALGSGSEAESPDDGNGVA